MGQFRQLKTRGLRHFLKISEILRLRLLHCFIDPNEDKILVEGISRFCDDLRLDPASFDVLLICWKFKAAVQCEFTRKEFMDGMLDLG